MIRVLHCISNLDRAGIETMLMNYYRHMDHEKVQFDFLCNKTKPGSYDKEVLEAGGRIYHTPGLNPLKFFQYQKYMSELFRRHPEYRIIHVHNGALGVYALYGARKNGIPWRIFHAHGANIAFDLKWPLKMLCKTQLKRNCNLYWTCGEKAAECYFGERIVRQKKCLTIRNAIDTKRFSFSPEIREKIRRQMGLEEAFIIGHIGRFMAQKNHDFLIDIFREIRRIEPKAVLVLLGDGELQEKIRRKARSLAVGHCTLMMGNVDNAWEWYQAFDAFVLPSVWEGLPVVGIEAQAANLPCFFSDSITEEVKITENAAFISLKKKPEEWAKIIVQGAKGRSRKDVSGTIAGAGYDIGIEARKLQKYYESLEKRSSHENRNFDPSLH